MTVRCENRLLAYMKRAPPVAERRLTTKIRASYPPALAAASLSINAMT